MIRFWGLWATLLLTACGGGGGGGGGSDGAGGGIDPRLVRIDVYESQRIRVVGDPDIGVMGMAQTEPADMPTTGAVTYDGSVTIIADTSPAITTLVGDAQVQMDFDGGPMTGEMTNVFGIGQDAALRDYDGALTVDGGSIGPDQTWTLDYAGTLSGDGQTMVFDGTVAGEFLGPEATAIAGAGFSDSVAVDGTDVDMVITIIGERDISSP